MTSHNKNNKDQDWRAVKAKLIARFGTIRAVAKKLGCHHNSVRYSKHYRADAESLVT